MAGVKKKLAQNPVLASHLIADDIDLPDMRLRPFLSLVSNLNQATFNEGNVFPDLGIVAGRPLVVGNSRFVGLDLSAIVEFKRFDCRQLLKLFVWAGISVKDHLRPVLESIALSFGYVKDQDNVA